MFLRPKCFLYPKGSLIHIEQKNSKQIRSFFYLRRSFFTIRRRKSKQITRNCYIKEGNLNFPDEPKSVKSGAIENGDQSVESWSGFATETRRHRGAGLAGEARNLEVLIRRLWKRRMNPGNLSPFYSYLFSPHPKHLLLFFLFLFRVLGWRV